MGLFFLFPLHGIIGVWQNSAERAVIVVRIIEVKMSDTSNLGSVYFQRVFEGIQIRKSRAHPQLWNCFNSQTSVVSHKSSCAEVYLYAKLRFLH